MQKKENKQSTEKRTAEKPSAKPQRISKTKRGTKSSLFKFRRYKKEEGGKIKKAKHPKLIVDEQKENYGFMGLTESPKRGHHKNIELKNNPQKGKKGNAFLRDEVRYDDKKNFGHILEDYNLSAEDKTAVINYLKRRKKKK